MWPSLPPSSSGELSRAGSIHTQSSSERHSVPAQPVLAGPDAVCNGGRGLGGHLLFAAGPCASLPFRRLPVRTSFIYQGSSQ